MPPAARPPGQAADRRAFRRRALSRLLWPAGLALGLLSALAGAVLLPAGAVPLLLTAAWPRPHRAVLRALRAAAGALVDLDRRRLAYYYADPGAAALPEGGRAGAYLAARVPVGLLGGAVLFLLVWGAGTGLGVLALWLSGHRADGIAPSPAIVGYFAAVGVVLAYLVLQGIAGVVALERRLARRFLGPDPRELLERRVAELATSRADVVDDLTDERRRIERDLHDGVQQRLVALGMLLGRARRSPDPERADALYRRALEESERALRELKEVSWRVFPAALDHGGLNAALEALAERASVPVRIHSDVPDRPANRIDTVAYFVVSEAVTNAAKHASAALVTVHVTQRDGRVAVRVGDDGVGGADPAGGGLSGLARRVASVDGAFAVHSPPGGPTTVTAELPC
ncbi:sensor histidine kinase [Allonocardiopsis opalescens]|uniref:histidine kinase n=1 Tax=Allonocardiopsis opalescens TaxID=1144618 RepID=A0A2T0PTB5_9ACTN|nr:histidine kinase [Allonocardiopsis opalescens]PRX92144.1 signal transduction histidine kinase [Allonocardiopsis opalescens]